MKIAIVSDTHFGYAWDSDREDDSFENAREAVERTRDADVVILPGDIFDNKVPKQEVLDRAADVLNGYREGEPTVSIADDSDVMYDFDGTAVVAIHGTHERRTQGFVNPIELLETAGYLLHLHNERVVFEKGGERVAIHGMSGVPERYAPTVLEKFDPQPLPDAYNVFVFHQSVENFVYTDADHDVLSLEQLPEGFDLLVDGHIHWMNLDNVDGEKPLIFPGSTITTQMNKVEAETPKGFVTVDTETGEVEFHELERTRPLYYEEVDVSGMDATAILDRVEAVITDRTGHDQKPLVRLILQGDTDAHITPAEIRRRYQDDVILSLSLRFDTDDDIAAGGFEQDERSAMELGRDLLHEKLDADDQRIDTLFDLLADDELDEAVALIEEMDAPEREEKSREEDEEQQDGGRGAVSENDSGDGGGTAMLTDYTG